MKAPLKLSLAITVSIVVVLLVVAGALWKKVGRPPAAALGEGFKSFYTPRDFDDIGTVMEVTHDGTWFRLGKLSLDAADVQRNKAESVPTYEAYGSFAFDAATKILGSSLSIGSSGRGSNEDRVHIQLRDAIRDIANVPSGESIKTFLASSRRGWNGNSKYFVVLEEIKCGGITYTASQKSVLKAGLKGNLSQSLSGSTFAIVKEQGESVELTADFPGGRRAVFYKPYAITPSDYALVHGLPSSFVVEDLPAATPAPARHEWPPQEGR